MEACSWHGVSAARVHGHARCRRGTLHDARNARGHLVIRGEFLRAARTSHERVMGRHTHAGGLAALAPGADGEDVRLVVDLG